MNQEQLVRPPGFEPGSSGWQPDILPGWTTVASIPHMNMWDINLLLRLLLALLKEMRLIEAETIISGAGLEGLSVFIGLD